MSSKKKKEEPEPSASPVSSRQLLFGSWTGKLPMSILHEYCQKSKWNTPIYEVHQSRKGYSCTLILQKTVKSEVMKREIKAANYYDNGMMAKHAIATVALHRMHSNTNMHTMLPPIIRDLWKKLDQAKHEMDADLAALQFKPDPFVGVVANDQSKSESTNNSKSKEKVDHSPESKYPLVHISKELRERVEMMIRSNPIVQPLPSTTETEQDGHSLQSIERILIRREFRAAHVTEALQYTKTLEEAYNWLLIHVPEDDLPNQLKIVEKHVVADTRSGGIERAFMVQRLRKNGFGEQKVEEVISKTGLDEYRCLINLCLDISGIEIDQVDDSVSTAEDLEEEREVLESIYPGQVQVQTNKAGTKFTVSTDSTGIIEICIPKDSVYPNEIPGIALQGDFPAYIKLSTIQKVYRECLSFLGAPMIFNIITVAEETIRQVVENPPPLMELYPKGKALDLSITPSNRVKTTKIQKRKVKGDASEDIRLFKEKLESPKYLKMLEGRKRLPSFGYKEKILSVLNESRALIICGETGCGKSTQLGQFILEDVMTSGNGICNIMCTQPRRISATSLAERVAAEMDDAVGGLVGYSIRGESKQSAKTKLIFCTTGVLLRMAQNDPELAHITHIIIDEVHERGVDSDFLLILLRDLVQTRKDLKVVLMSATIEAGLISNYFNCPVIEIPGFTHPVEDIYLESILKKTGHKLENLNIKVSKVDDEEDDDMDFDSKRLLKVEKSNLFQIDYGLIASTVQYICENHDDGAILIFLPGIMEIKKCINRIKDSCRSVMDSLRVFPLHSNLTTKEQSQVFQKMPKGIRKVVVSTNIAETSVTIDDVVFVVDTGRVKEMMLKDGVLSLVEKWGSLAALKQRRGRAGRVRPGVAYKLYSHTFARKHMAKYTEPEILRLPLEQLCLQIKSMGIGDVREFLGKALSPPPLENVQQALQLLENLNALNENYDITPLGKHISQLPADVRIGKMLIFGAIFKCIDAVLTVAAYVSGKSPLLSPVDKREEATEKQKQFLAFQSDQLTVCNAYNEWLEHNGSQQWAFCEENYISMTTMKAMTDLRRQFCDMLVELGYVSKDNWDSLNVHSKNDRVVKSIILAGLYPNVASIDIPRTMYNQTAQGAVAVMHKSSEIKYFVDQSRVFVHPSSTLFSEDKYEQGSVMVFGSQVATSKVFIRDCSAAPGIALILLGGKVEILRGGKAVKINNIRLQTSERVSALISGMRRLLDLTLEQKINDPSIDVLENDLGKLCIDLLQAI